MRKVLSLIFVILTLGLLALPAYAGHYVLKYEEKGQVSVELITDRLGRQSLFCRVLPLTADRTPGPAVLRLNGSNVWQWPAPAYECTLPLYGDYIPVLAGDPKRGGQLVIPWLKGSPDQKIPLSHLTKGVNQIEVYFASVDDRGHLDRNRTAAPATQFRIEEETPPAAAETEGGQPLTATQLEDAIKQSYDKGVEAGKSAGATEREQLLAELKKATDELNKLRKQAALKNGSVKMPTVCFYLPISWAQQKWPMLNDKLCFTKDGHMVADAKVVELFPQCSRIWVLVELPADFDFDNGCSVVLPSDRGGKQ